MYAVPARSTSDVSNAQDAQDYDRLTVSGEDRIVGDAAYDEDDASDHLEETSQEAPGHVSSRCVDKYGSEQRHEDANCCDTKWVIIDLSGGVSLRRRNPEQHAALVAKRFERATDDPEPGQHIAERFISQ